MADRAAIITGASSGIGLELARMLGSESYALTLVARRAEKLEQAADTLRQEGFELQTVALNVAEESSVKEVVTKHRDRYGRLDVLANNAGVGFGGAIDDYPTKRIDMQLEVNLRSSLFYREAAQLLRTAGSENGALVLNTASVAGKTGQGWLSIYSATKAAVIGFTQAMNKELSEAGIKSCALCPGFVDTPMTDFVKESVPPSEMIQPSDIAEMARALLHLSRHCVVPEIVFHRTAAEF